MANSNSNQFAQSVVDKINNAKRSLRSIATSLRSSLSEVDSTIVNSEKKVILMDGLAGLLMDANELKVEKDDLQKVVQYILDNVPELTR